MPRGERRDARCDVTCEVLTSLQGGTTAVSSGREKGSTVHCVLGLLNVIAGLHDEVAFSGREQGSMVCCLYSGGQLTLPWDAWAEGGYYSKLEV